MTTLAFISFSANAAPASDAAAPKKCPGHRPLVVGYYPTWSGSPLQNITWSKLTHANFAFGILQENGTFTLDGESFIDEVVKEAHNHGVSMQISLGGWSASNLFTPVLANTKTRKTLVEGVADFIKKHDLDGVDFDWEYPGRLGNTCNKYDPENDAKNLLTLLSETRHCLNSRFGVGKKGISLAVRVQPFDGPDGPLKDVSEYAKYVNFTSIMGFDINTVGQGSTGANAPLNAPKNAKQPFSLAQAIDDWTSAGWPKERLVAGVPFYGRSFQALQGMTKNSTYIEQPAKKTPPHGDKTDAPFFDKCANSTSLAGTWQYLHLRDQGLLSSPTTAAGEWVRTWDNATQTPWLFNTKNNTFISYDDPQSLRIKVNYAAKKGLAGTMIWALGQDYNDELLDVLNSFGKN
ncbi:hypothetical protein H4219_001919 [Mycoemilia scoparia]|uniref:GH18 domain-containing protein n=1 Tax=Mycoemilia scoparia TaxID=417184 RepID=A0A9W7ZZ08_9FUNG|nr:hypothetical protein H4219_001919 [Mycoemilia scoparia]